MANPPVIEMDGATGEVRPAIRRSAFVDPNDTTELTLSDGSGVTIKTYLTYGERKRMEAAGLKTMRTAQTEEGDERSAEIGLDFWRFDLEKLRTWIVDWDFRDRQGKHVDPSPQNIDHLAPEVAQEILELITKHDEAQQALRKNPSGSR